MSEDAERQAQERVGCVLDDKWTLERLLGVGGMAAVYAATHRNGARAAVKVLHGELSRHKEVRERFLREGYAANRVEHPGAVKVLDDDVVVAGPESGTAYIVMELLEGESLQDRLERGPPMGEAEFLAMAGSVLEVLEAAHSRGVVHRDLKPENLFLVRADEAGGTPNVKVKVLDFGLARIVQSQAITSYGLALGTPSFMSPEQAAGRIDEIDGRTDLFALAATGFRICAGRRIHEATNPVDLVRKMASLAAPKIRTVRPEVSEAFSRVIDRALEFRREDRYETAGAMRDDVTRALAELEVSGPTQLAVPAPSARSTRPVASVRPAPASVRAPEASSGDQTTIELSRRDLQAELGDVARPGMDESVRLPRRRSVLPWLALLVAGAGGGALWLHVERRDLFDRIVTMGSIGLAPAESTAVVPLVAPSASAAAEPPSASGAPSAVPAATAQVPVVVRDRDAGPDASAEAKTPTTSATHRAAPGNGAPANAHKPSKKHHAAKPHPTST